MKSDLAGKRVLVMGLGLHGGGAAAVEFFARQRARVTVTDLRTRRELAPSLRVLTRIKGVTYVLGRHRKEDFLHADTILKNPGVPADSPYLQIARRHGATITADVNIFFDKCPATIIGVTGTRGKSTTAHLIFRFLKRKYRRVFLAGNIRVSVLDILPQLRKDDLVVLELSSFQLQDMAPEKKSPQIAVLTNILRDHLNRHKSMREYMDAKSVIFKYQKPDDYLFVNRADPRVRAMTRRARGQVLFPRLNNALKPIVDRNLGPHYRSSVALAQAVARQFGIRMKDIAAILSSFHGLPERQEEIAVKRGVHFIDDTTATTPDAAVAAIRRFRPYAAKNHLILIAGGADKNLDFREMARVMRSSADTIILLPGSATKKLIPKLAGKKIYQADSMKKAVNLASRDARKGDYVILSPGAASFGLFSNEFDRGAHFKKAVRALPKS